MNFLPTSTWALLIQDITPLINFVQGYLQGRQEWLLLTHLERERFIEWLVIRCLHRSHYLDLTNTPNFHPNNRLFESLYNFLLGCFDMHAVSHAFIKVPQLYGDRTDVTAEIKHNSLYLRYNGVVVIDL